MPANAAAMIVLSCAQTYTHIHSLTHSPLSLSLSLSLAISLTHTRREIDREKERESDLMLAVVVGCLRKPPVSTPCPVVSHQLGAYLCLVFQHFVVAP